MILDLVRMKGKSLRPIGSKRFLLPIFIGLLVSLVSQASIAPQANGAAFGTKYNAPAMSFGGGNYQGVNECPADQVIVGVTFNQNPMSWGYKCSGLNSDFTVPALSSTLRATANYVFCPDGKAAVGFKMINSGGNRLGLSCKTLPLVNDTEVLTDFVANSAATKFVTRTTQTFNYTSLCNSGDILVGAFIYSNLWFDQLGGRCAPFNKFTVTYNANGGTGTIPSAQTQGTPAQSLTTASWSGTRSGFHLSGWNTLANGLGTDYAHGATILPSGPTTLYAKWTSTITYDGNTNSGGDVPDPTVAVSSAAITKLSTNSGNLVKTGFTFAGWNTSANGSGTSYSGYGYSTPLLRYVATDYDTATKVWSNSGSAGSAYNISSTGMGSGTGITKISTTSGVGGSNNSFTTLKGGTTSKITFPNAELSNYTLCHVARYAGATKQRIFTHPTVNWLSGYLTNQSGYYYGVGNSGTAGLLTGDTNWHLICDYNSNFRNNGTAVAATGRTSLPANIGVSTWSNQSSDWEIAEVLFYDVALGTAQIQRIEEDLASTYGLSTYSTGTGSYASTGDTTLYAQWNSTITYNGNGQTSASSTVPTATTAKGTAANTTLSNAGTMVKTGYSFAGWNTQADGLGTNYASGLTTYQSAGSVTLYAKWTATVTYDPNGASGSPATSGSDNTPRTSDLFVNSAPSISLSNLPTVGTMVKPGFTFGGWNSAANGTGVNYSPATPTPYMQFKATDFDDVTNSWTDSSGNDRNIPGIAVSGTSGNIRGNPTLIDVTGNGSTVVNGSTATFKAVKGGTGDGIVIGNEALAKYTLCHVARYAGSARTRIFAGTSGNWLSGYWNSGAGIGYHEGWITGQTGTNDTNWRVICDIGGSPSGLRSNGVDKTTTSTNATGLPANISINLQGSRSAPTESSDWEVAEVVIYVGILNQYQIETLENSLKTAYGISGYTAPSTPASAGSFSGTGNTTLYARWFANGYNVTFDTSTVTSGVMPSQWFSAGTAFPLPANAFSRPGYTFKNWNTASNGSGTTYTNSQSVTLYSDLTLYPQWTLLAPGVPTVTVEPGNTEITVTPVAAASSSTVGPPTSILVTAYNSSGVALNPVKTCTVVSPATSCVISGLTNGTTYQFGAVSINATATSASSTKVNGVPAGVAVTYNATTNSGTTATASATYGKPTALVLPSANKDGFTFAGWYNASTGGALIGGAGGNYSPNISASIINRSLTSNVATLTTSSPHGFVVGMSVIVVNINTTFNGTYTIASVPTTTTFTYAKTATNVSAAAVSPAGKATVSALTLYAQFVGNTYTISYNGNGSTGGTVPSNGSYQAGSTANKQAFDYTGTDQDFTVPSDITGAQQILVEIWGAGGGGTKLYYAPDFGGGAGGYTKATISTPTPGEVLKVRVGKGGSVGTITADTYSGGGAGGNVLTSPGNSGGGYSGVFTGSTPLAISGGGGGASPGHDAEGKAGGGGGANQNGTTSTNTNKSGGAGTTTAGGAAAVNCATAGTQYTGGNGCSNIGHAEGGGGGGGGYYGGGGGDSNGQSNGGGGGGSGYLNATRGTLISATVGELGAANTTWAFPDKTSANYGTTNAGRGGKGNTNTTADSNGGNGRVVIQWNSPSNQNMIQAGPTRVGYTFAGWNTKADGTGDNYAVNDFYATNANVSLFAKWTAAARSVAYALDGGSSSATTTTLTGKVVGNTITLPASNTMSKTGYVFAGWNDGATTFAGGATWTVPASDNNFTLTAQWTTQTLSYSYDTNGGGTAPASGTKTYGQSLVLEASTGLSKTGYTFAGWNDGSTTHLAGATITLNTSKVFVAQWNAQSYSITYSGNGSNSGSVTAGSYVAGGVPYAIAANGFTKTGYTFAGWKDASNNSFTVGSGYSTAANLVLTAQWTASSYTVTYNGNGSTGGTAPVDGAYTTDVAFSVSTNSGNLVKAGYTFAGWNSSAAGNGTTYSENGALTTSSNIILYAKWTIVSPTITFNKGTATITPTVFPSNTSAQYGSVFTLPTTDTSTVISDVTQIFTGWNDGANTYAVGDTYRMGTTNVTFTAQWVAVYTVRYVLNGGSGSVPADVLRTNNFTETLTSASVTKSGFTLTGWKDQSGASITAGANSWLITGTSYVAYAQWSPTQRTLSFNVNGGSDSQASITGKVIGELVTLPTPTSTKTGYTFTGWSNSGTTYPAGGTFVVGNGDAAFVAAWTGNVNIITYNGNGSTGGTAPVSGSYVSGESTPYTVSGNTGTLVKSGFTFDNWYTTSTGSGGAAYTAGSGTLTTTSNLILYAKWSAASYAVTYASGDNTITAPTQSNTMYGSSFSLPSALTRTGYSFLGWETGSGTDANLYAPGSSFTMGSSAITFTAKWGALSYVIVYSLNGGSGDTPTQANVEYNQGFTTAAAPTKSGFTFAGWSDGATTTNASTSISNVTANKTLTAQWTIALPGTPGAPTAAPGNGGATITISAPNTGGAPSSYTVTALDNSGNPLSPSQTCTVVSPGTSCSISPLTNGTAYKFSATATNAAGTSASGSTASGAVIPASAPSAPLGVAGSGTGASAAVTWSAPSDNGGSAITDYVVEYRVATSGSWTTFSDGVSTTTSATVTGLTAGSSYEFRVTAKNLIGNSLASFTSPVLETLPSVPTITGVTASSGQVTVAWNAPAHLGSGTLTGDEYIVTAYDTQGNEAGTCKPTSGERSCAVTGLDNGSAYTFKVEAVTTVGTSEKSLTSSSVTPSGTPSAPADVVAVTSGSNMTVTFTAPADNGGAAITSYVITSSPVGATCTVGANATTYICSGLTTGANYTFTAKAVNVRGQSSASQPSTAVIAIAAPSAPQNISAVITAGSTTLSATVSFDAPATDNGSAVISYTVTASPGGATCTVTAPDLFCEIPVLPDSIYTFTATATNAVGRSVASVTSLQTAASNGIAPSLVDNPIAAPTGDVIENQVLTSTATYTATPNAVLSYVWKRCTDQFDDTTCTNISGATSSTYTLTSADVDKFIRVATTATNSIGTSTDLSQATEAITAAPVVTPAPTPAPSTPSVTPAPTAPSCDEACQAARDAASTKFAADAAAKAAADKLAADAAAKLKADAAATTASTKANAAAAAAAAAAKAAVEKAAAAEAAKIAAEAAAASAAAKAKAAADAQTAANKAAATAAAALKNSAASAAAKAAATASAQKAAANAAAAVKAAATAAQQAATAKNSAANANKQVDIAINSLNSKTAASQASAQANAIAAAAKAAANEAAAAAATKASEAKAAATAAQKAAADTAARIATEQKEAATAAAAAKAAADAAAKATAEKIAATNAAKTASENLLKVLEEKATLAEQAAKTSDENVRAEIAKKLEEIEVKAVEAEKIAEEATAEADDAVAEYEEAIDQATEATEVAETQAAEAVAVKAESVTKTAVATKAAAAATVAAKVATAAKAAAAKVPSKAVITKKPSTTSKNSATATVTGLKPGQKVKVTVNVKPKP